jgi:hypothetical protein
MALSHCYLFTWWKQLPGTQNESNNEDRRSYSPASKNASEKNPGPQQGLRNGNQGQMGVGQAAQKDNEKLDT